MKKINLLPVLLPVILPVCLAAQSMTLLVVGASGGDVTTAAGTLHWTVGETAVAGRPASGLYWGEGFQQAWVAPLVSAGDPGDAQAVSLTAYPNPAAQYLNVETDMPGLQAQMFDLAGRPVTDLIQVNGFARFVLGALPAGFYLLRAFDENGRLAGVAKIQHIQ